MSYQADSGTLFLSNATTAASAATDLTTFLTTYSAVISADERGAAVTDASDRPAFGYWSNVGAEFQSGRTAPVARRGGEVWTAVIALPIPPHLADRISRTRQGLAIAFSG